MGMVQQIVGELTQQSPTLEVAVAAEASVELVVLLAALVAVVLVVTVLPVLLRMVVLAQMV